MAAVDPLYAQWLQSDADRVVRTDGGSAARWGSSAIASERITGVATRAAAQIEADRQLAFFGQGPFAEDVHELVGLDWEGALGRVIKVRGDQLAYDNGVDVLVIAVRTDRSTGISTVTVLRPLRGL